MKAENEEPEFKPEPEGWCRRLTTILGALGIWFAVTGKESTRQMMFIAALIAGIWVYWYGYDYRSPDQLRIDTFNVTTWVCWTLGLLAAGFVYQAIKRNTSLSLVQRVALTGVLWTVSIMVLEWIGYNKMNIKLKSNYPGLFGLELMHGPWYLKVFYLSAWAVFLSFMGMW